MAATASIALRKVIEDDIDAGRLQPGDALDEQMLATRFDVSRTPAREALLHLAAVGVVEMVPRRGAVISGLSPDFGIGMVEVLTALEAEAASLAARRMSDLERAKLIKIHRSTAQLVKRMDGDAYIVVNTIFHEAIYDGARNTFLKEQLTLTRRRMRSYHRSSLTKPARVRASWEEHAAVADAIVSGDAAAAQAAMRNHIVSGGTVFADLVAHQRLESARRPSR